MEGDFKNQPLRMLCTFLVLYIGIKAVGDEWDGYEDGVMAVEFWLITLILLSLVSMVGDVHSYKFIRKRIQFIPSLIGLGFLLAISFHKIKTAGINASPTIFSARTIPGTGQYIRIDFKEADRFKLTEGSLLGSSYHYGRYSRKGDTLIIRNTSYKKHCSLLPLKAIIKDSLIVWNGFDTMLIEPVRH